MLSKTKTILAKIACLFFSVILAALSSFIWCHAVFINHDIIPLISLLGAGNYVVFAALSTNLIFFYIVTVLLIRSLYLSN